MITLIHICIIKPHVYSIQHLNKTVSIPEQLTPLASNSYPSTQLQFISEDMLTQS